VAAGGGANEKIADVAAVVAAAFDVHEDAAASELHR